MKRLKPKIIMIILFFISVMFFSNDFGLIDIEKTAIITAIAIDKTPTGEYQVTCQIAVPESSNAVTENQKAQISGKGSTIGQAIKDTGSKSGWFPQTIFCNLIIIGEQLAQDNVITVLDYFSKTMRVQDSAQVVLAEKKASELLNSTTPLDNISSFAIQKILLKNPGFDQDVASVDVKDFCTGYYSPNQSSFMPMIKVISCFEQGEQTQNQGGSGGSSGGSSGGNSGGSSGQEQGTKTQGKNLYDATTTALFLQGKKVGEIPKELTQVFNLITGKINGTAFSVDDINGVNYLLAVVDDRTSFKVCADQNQLTLKINVNLYCKISDQNSNHSDSTYEKNNPLPYQVKLSTEQMLKDNLFDLIQASKTTGCDFLKIKEKLYRYNYKQYSQYKDNFLQVLKPEISVTVNGQT